MSEETCYQATMAQTAKEHEGYLPKDSDAARLQSEHDKAEANKDKDFKRTAARVILQSAGETPPDALNPAKGGKEAKEMIPDEVWQYEEQEKEQKKQKTVEEMKESSHVAVMDTP